MDNSSPEDVLALAEDNEREWIGRNLLCQAYYFIGQWHLWHGNESSAFEYFRQAVATEAIYNRTFDFANAELERIGG